MRANPPLYFPGREDGEYVPDYYEDPYGSEESSTSGKALDHEKDGVKRDIEPTVADASGLEKGSSELGPQSKLRKRPLEPRERFLQPVAHLSVTHPQRLWGYVKFGLLQGVTRDCVTHNSVALCEIHARANKYDIRVEHLWTYCQVASAMIMSIAHGSNDVANAVGPWAASYETYQAGVVATRSATPVWILVVAGFLLGAGFWFYGYHIIRALGNKITQMSPTRGFSVELGAAITVLLASRLALPVSTTQCLAGSTMGVALMNYDLGAVNWRQLAFIFLGWVLTLPAAGLIAGLLCVMAVNAPGF